MASKRIWARVLQVCLATCLWTATAHAEDYPSRPIRIVLSFPPGGGADAIARPLAQQMGKTLGQALVIDNRPGANGIVSLELVAKSPADGYTLILSNVGPIAINPALYGKLPYDAVNGFAPISLVGTSQYVVLVHPGLHVSTLQDFIKLAKARPGSINYATSGVGSTPHLAGELLKAMAGINIVSVQYKGGGPALIDLLSGQVSMFFTSVPAALPYMKAGKLVGLAVSGARRAAAVPQLPTVAESGVPGYEVEAWYGVMAPAGTEPARLNRIAGAIHDALRTPEMRRFLASQGVEPASDSPAEFSAYIRKEMDKWRTAVRYSGVKAES